MFGPVYLCGKPIRPRRRFKLRHALAAAPLAFIGLTGSIGQQDISALMSAGGMPSWMQALETVDFSSQLPPTLTLAQATPLPAPELTLEGVTVSAPQGMQNTVIKGLEPLVRETLPTEVPDEIRINRTGKGDRFMSMAPDREMLEQASGSVYAMASLIGNGGQADMPRVAFVKPEPLTADQRNQFASAAKQPKGSRSKGTEEAGEPMDLQRMMMARNAAAAGFSLVSAYAPEAADTSRDPFTALFGPQYEVDLPPPEDPQNPHWWAQKPLPLSVVEPKEQRCMAEAIYFEARGESEEGQVAVAQVVLNRVKNPAYPNSICEVVYQNQNRRNQCQFSFACDGIPDRITSQAAWTKAQRLAKEVVSGQQYLKMVDASTHYHATYVKPRWAGEMNKRGQIGLHIFYKTKAGGWN
ncbi:MULTISPECIES: cell wall hydrolase [Pannonibacter]|uniref:cell wall hydrolase n=1 Tax=Pannonibacter TaxID=227873 RepID=UPI000B979C2E|nr:MULTISPECIES: cell wall hydrolase [Pannonibacter]